MSNIIGYHNEGSHLSTGSTSNSFYTEKTFKLYNICPHCKREFVRNNSIATSGFGTCPHCLKVIWKFTHI